MAESTQLSQYVRGSIVLSLAEFAEREDKVACVFSSAVVALEGVLDGFVILDQADQTSLTRSMSFKSTNLNDQGMRDVQEKLRSLKSSLRPDRGTYVDFWAVADFWKHYMPYQPRPSSFDRDGIMDYQLRLGYDVNDKSGPILKDLIVPAFNAAVAIAHQFATQIGQHNL